jgi:hypothetical protein
MVRLIVSVSELLCVNGIGALLLLLTEEAVIVEADEEVTNALPLLDSSKAFKASCVKEAAAAVVGALAGNNCRTAEFGRKALWNKLEFRFNVNCDT